MSNSSSSSSDSEVLTGDFDQFASAVVTNVIILTAVIVVFWILRSMPRFDYFFMPHYYDSLDKGDERQMLPLLPRTPWGFAKTVISFPEERILYLRGLDSVMYLRLVKALFILFVLYIPFGIGILIPVDHTGGGGESGIPKISMTNIRDGSRRLYAHTCIAFVFTFIAFYILWQTYKSWSISRNQWMKDDKARNYSVMFKGVPHEQAKRGDAQAYFANICPSQQVVGAHFVSESDLLHQWIGERKISLKNLHYANGDHDATGERPQHKMRPLIGPKVDSIEQYNKEVNIYNREIATAYDRFSQNPTYGHVGFATYATVEDAFTVINSSIPVNAGLTAIPAPEPDDVYWEKLNRSRTVGVVTRILTYFITFALVFLWAIPIVFIQGIANLENLSKVSGFGWLSGVVNWNPIAQGLIQQFLPSLFTILFLALLPRIIEAIVKFRGVYTHSDLNRQVLKIYFLFLIFNVFLVTMWAGGIFSVISKIANTSGWTLVQSLGSGIAAQGIFFINYVMVYMLFKYPLNIIRIGDFVMALIKKPGCKTEEHRRDVQRPQAYNFGTSLAVLILLFAIGITYAVLSAFIIPFVVVFFGVVYLVNKYMLIYVYYPKWDSGGLHFPVAFNRIIASLMLSQFILICVFILRKSASAAICGPLPIFTLIFAIAMHWIYDRPATILPQGEYASAPRNGAKFARAYADPIHAAQMEDYHQTDIEHTKQMDSEVGQKNGFSSPARM